MTNTDTILLIPLVWGLAWGFYKGLVSQITSLVGMIAVFYISIKYYNPVALLINSHIESKLSQRYISIAAFVVLFLVLLLLLYFLSGQIEKLIKAMHMGILNHFTGALFGLVKWAFIVSFVIALINKFSQELNTNIVDFHHTWVYEHIEMIARKVMPDLLKR